MVARYVHSASAIVATYVNDYDYNPTNYLAADETYVKVKGVNHYVWFVMDAIKKSILGHAVSSKGLLNPAWSHAQSFLSLQRIPRLCPEIRL